MKLLDYWLLDEPDLAKLKDTVQTVLGFLAWSRSYSQSQVSL
jgi:hypothetical protein